MEQYGREQTPEEAARALEIAEALGSAPPIYIGDMFPVITPLNAAEAQKAAEDIRFIRALPETEKPES